MAIPKDMKEHAKHKRRSWYGSPLACRVARCRGRVWPLRIQAKMLMRLTN